MKKRNIVLASCLALTAAACGAEEATESLGAEGKADDAATIVLTAADDGTTVEASIGQKISVELDANPSTGYEWKVVATNRTFGYPETEEFRSSDPTQQAVGSGGTAVYTWAARGPGHTHTVEMAYARPWESEGEPARTFEFSVKVTAPANQPFPPNYCENGRLVAEPNFVPSADDKMCELPTMHCVTNDYSACPQYSPLPPGWCADGTIVQGADSFVASADGMECQMPSVHCVTKDWEACPALSPRPPNWCADGKIVRGKPSFIDSADGKECEMPSSVCVTKDWSACPQL